METQHLRDGINRTFAFRKLIVDYYLAVSINIQCHTSIILFTSKHTKGANDVCWYYCLCSVLPTPCCKATSCKWR